MMGGNGGCWWWRVLVVIVSILSLSHAVTIMSIDFGSEWMKVAVVAPGVPMEIALNKESKRKTPAAVSYRNNERSFGEDALTNGVRFPATNYFYLLDLLGKKIDNPVVDLYKTRFPFYNIEEDEERGTVIFRHSDGKTYSVEELVGQLLSHARDLAAAHTGQRIKDCVITVPPFFNQAERRAILTAADLGGLKVLSLMSSNAAVSLNHGMFRRKEINATAEHILFYDMGASSTTATIVAYQTVKTKDRGYSETNPQVTILGVGYDRTLGGLEMQLRLRDFLAKKFNAVKKTSNSVYDSPRGMAKLFKEAGRLLKVLSANSEHLSQVEGVLDDEDLKVHVKREEFETLCSDVFERVRAPIDGALISAGMDISTIDQFIIVGGATRVPKVQSILQSAWGRELGKNINADEAAAMGAVYRAADLGQGFKVKKFHVKEAVLFPIEVDFEREIENEDGVKSTKTVKRVLFPTGNTYPQKKVMTFNKHTSDFVFSVNYGNNEHLPKDELRAASVENVSVIAVSGVTEAFKKHQEEEAKGIKAHFVMDDSGVLTLGSMEAVFEKTVMVEEDADGKDGGEEESTLSKLGSTISKLFSGSEEEKADNKENQTDAEGEEKAKEKDKDKKKKKKKEEEKKSEGEKKEGEGKTEEKKKKEKEVKPKQVTVKEELNFTQTHLDVPDMTVEGLQKAKKKLEDINKEEAIRLEQEAARNTLETNIIYAQDKLYQEEYEVASTQEEREAIQTLCSQLDDWLYEDGMDQPASVYRTRINELSKLFDPIKERVQQHRDRPDAIQALLDMINASSMFVQKAHEAPPEQQLFTDVELTAIDKLIVDTQKWMEDKTEEQEKTPLSSNPKLTLAEIAEKWNALDREIKYLINKAKIVKAKKDREAAEARAKAEKEEKEKEKEAKKKANSTKKEGEKEEEEEAVVVEEKEGGEEYPDLPQSPIEPEESVPLDIFEETPEENQDEEDRRKGEQIEEVEEEEEEEISDGESDGEDDSKSKKGEHLEL